MPGAASSGIGWPVVIGAPGGRDTIQDAAALIGWPSSFLMYYGTEFHSYKSLEARLPVKFYFPTPHHSWERGSNENMNGLIRQYLPRGVSMEHLTQADCDRIATKLDQRPRKRYDWHTPEELHAA